MPIDYRMFDEWITNGPCITKIHAESSALIIVDMTYISSGRNAGVGEILKSKKTDFGNYFYDRCEQFLIPNQNKLAEFFRASNMPVIFLTFSPVRRDARDLYPLGQVAEIESRNRAIDLFNTDNKKIMGIVDELKIVEGDMVINKLSSGAFYTSPLDATLRNMGIKTLFFTGVCTNMCVESTAREAVDRGYNAILIDDATATYKPEWQKSTCEIFSLIFGATFNTQDVIDEFPWSEWGKYDL
ncbi:MAG: isochorismatase family cysteine hydrolase [Eubacteriales bacterium]